MEETKKEQKFYEVDTIEIHTSRPGEFILSPNVGSEGYLGESARVKASRMDCWMKTPLKALYYEEGVLTVRTPHHSPFTCVLEEDTLVCKQ
jgi:hypothetical protein